MIAAFDCDGTLLNFDNTPNYAVLDIYRWFVRNHHHVIVWSGGGLDYARHCAGRLGLLSYQEGATKYHDPQLSEKTKEAADRLKPDICFDDEFVKLATVNIKVNPRLTPIV